MLLGLVKPSSGQAFVLGVPSDDIDVRAKIGFLPEDFRFYTWLTASELLKLHGRLCGMPASLLRERVPALLDLVGLSPHREKRLRELYAQREEIYRRTGTMVLTDSRPLREIAGHVLRVYRLEAAHFKK